MTVIGNKLFKNDGTLVSSFETHSDAVHAMLNDWDEYENYRDIPLELTACKFCDGPIEEGRRSATTCLEVDCQRKLRGEDHKPRRKPTGARLCKSIFDLRGNLK